MESINTIPEIANTLAEIFAKTSSCDNYTPAFQALKRREERVNLNFSSSNEEGYNSPLTLLELRVALHRSDDVQISYSSKFLNVAEQRIQTTINNFTKWAEQNGFVFSTEKTIPSSFKRSQNQKCQGPKHPQSISKYSLGSILNILASPLIRSKLDYGSVVYSSACKSLLKILDPVHHQDLRLCLGAFRTSPVESLYTEAYEPPLDLRRKYLCLNHFMKIQSMKTNTAYSYFFNFSLYDFNSHRSSLTYSQPFHFRIRDLINDLNLNIGRISLCKIYEVPPWKEIYPKIDFTLSCYSKACTSSESHVGSAVVSLSTVITDALPISASIYTAELHALRIAIEHISLSCGKKFIIYTDSLSALQSIVSLHSSSHPILVDITYALANHLKKKDIRFCWIPGHAGITGNELADAAARSATGSSERFPILHSDLKACFRQKLQSVWQSNWDQQTENKLHSVMPILAPTVPSSSNCCEQVIWTRLRLGHTRLTHRHLLFGEPPPYCEICNVSLSKTQHDKIHSISENSLFEEWLSIAKYFLATNFNLDYRHLMIQFSRISLKKKQLFPGCAMPTFRHINKAILKKILAVMSRTPHPPAADDFFEKYFSHWIFLSFCGEFDLYTNSEEIRTKAVDVIDSVIDFVSCHSSYDAEIKNVIKTGIMSLDILIRNSEILMKEVSNNSIWELSFFNYMIQKICHLPYKNKLHVKLFGCKAIELLFKKFSVNTRCIYATEFLEHLLYLIEDLSIEGDYNSSNFGSLSQVKHTLAIIISFLFERQTLELDFKPFLKVFVMHIASPSEDVRIVVKSHLEKFGKALNKDLCRLLEPSPELYPSFSQIDELLKLVPLKSKIGIVDSYAFFAPVYKYGTVIRSQHAENLIYIAELCSEIINNEFNADSKDCIYYIKLCQVAFKVFCYFSFECCTTEVSDQSVDRDLVLDYYFSNFQHMYAMQQSCANYLSLLFVNADQTNIYGRYMRSFIELIKKFLAKIKPVNFSEEPDSGICSHTKEALCWLGENTAISIKNFINECVKTKPIEDNKKLFLILSGFLNCHPERNLRYFYFKFLGACHLMQKICLISYLENSLGVRWNEAIQEIFSNTKLPHERVILEKDFRQLNIMLSSENEVIFQSRAGSQQSSLKASLPNEGTCYAIEILIYLKEHNVSLYQNKEIIFLLQKSWIIINNSLSKNIYNYYDIQLREFSQLAELLLGVYKSSAENELLFDLLRAPIEQLPYLNFITDSFKNLLAERNNYLEEIFLSFIHYYNEKKYSSDVNVRIVEFLLIPSLIFSMKKADFKVSKQMIDGVLICFENLNVAELNLKIPLLRFSCLILEWASHNINDYFLKKLKDYVKEKDFQIEKKYIHPSVKGCWNLFWIYLFKLTETKLNKDFVSEVFQNSLEACSIDVQENSRHVLDILIPAICSDNNWHFHFTHWAQMILEEERTQKDFQIFSTKTSTKRALDDNLRFKHIFFVILNHSEAYDVTNLSFVFFLLKAARTLFNSSVIEEKKLAVDIVETLYKCAEIIYNKENFTEEEKIDIKKVFQMCGDLLINFTKEYQTDKSRKELHRKSTEIIKRIFGFFPLIELIKWFSKMDFLNIYNQLEFLNYLLSNHQDETFGFVVNFISVLFDSLNLSKVTGLFEKLIIELYEYAEVKLCNMPLSIKPFLEVFFEVIELVLKRTVWQPLYITIHWDDFLKLSFTDFPHLISSITLLFDKIAKSFENILRKLFKLSVEKCFIDPMNSQILAFFKFIDAWLNNFLLSEISKPDIVIPEVNTAQFREFINNYMSKCMIESLGWLILRLVINVYPKYLLSKKYINVLETMIRNYLKLFSSDDREGTQRIYLPDTKIIMALEIIELGCSETIYCDKIIGLLIDLIKKTSSKAILSIIMNIIKKYCVCIGNHNYKGTIQRLVQELAARIGQKFPNDTEICNLYFKIIEMFWFLFYRNSEIQTIRNDFSKISFKSEIHDTQQKFFCLFNKVVSKNISEKMMYLTSESYWQHTTYFYFAPCVRLIISSIKDDPSMRLFSLGSKMDMKKLYEDSMHSSEYSNNEDFYRNYDQKTQILLKTLDSFKNDLKRCNDSCFYTAVQKLIEFDDNLAKFLWNRLLPKIFSVLNEHDNRYVATLIEGFVQRELTKNKGIKHTENILSFGDIHLKNPELSLVTHSFLEFAGNFVNLCESSCLYLEDSSLQNYSCSESNCKICVKVQFEAYSALHENDLIKLLLEDEMSLYSVTNYFQLILTRMCYNKEMVHLTKLAKKKLLFFPQINDAYSKDSLGIKCLKEIDNWSNLRRSDGTIDYTSNTYTEIWKTFRNMKTLIWDEKASLVMVSDSIKNLIHLCIKNSKHLPPHVLTEKFYSLIKVRKKIANFEIAHLFQKLLFNHNSVNCFSNLMKILESWCFYVPTDHDVSFWEDIFVVRLCLLQCLPFYISTSFCKDKARILELKCMAQFTYNVLQIQRADMYLSQGYPEKCTKLLNCIHLESKTMNEHILPLYMDSVFLQIKQCDNDVEVKSILEHASSFLKIKLSQPMKEEHKIMHFICDKVISALQETDTVAKEVFLKPCHTLFDKSIGWIYCGKYFQKICNPGEAETHLKFAMQCFLQACRYKNEANCGDLIPRILWILSNDNFSLELSHTFLTDGGKDILTSCWLPWIPQLLTTFLRSKDCNLSYVLYSIGRKYPNSLYFLLYNFLEKLASRRDKKEHKKCLEEILHHMEENYTKLCFTLRNIRTEFLRLVGNVRLDVHNILKSIESEICDILYQSITKQSNVDIVSKISEIIPKKFSYFEGKEDSNIRFILSESTELSKCRDLNGFLRKFSYWIAYYEQRKKRTFPLEKMSKFLSTFHLHQEKIDMFVNSYSKPSIQISRFLPTVEIMEGYAKGACRILIQGDNGKIYPYLIIHNICCENIFREDRIFQFFTLLNSMLRDSLNHSLQIKIPTFVCIHPCLKVVQSVASTYSLLDIYNQHCTKIEQQNLVIPGCLKLLANLYHRKELIQNVDKSYRFEVFKAIQKQMIPKIILKKFVAQSVSDYMVSRRTFAKNIAVIGFSRFLFFLNKQLPEKLFINLCSGEVLPFGLNFNVKSTDDDQDIYMPVQLTENISEFIGPFGIPGYVESTIVKCVQCFYKHIDEIESFLQILLLEDLEDTNTKYRPYYHSRVLKIIHSISQNIEDYADEYLGEHFIKHHLKLSRTLDVLSSTSPSQYPWL
ncbi:uncharacterized protein TNCT_376901 [Trichonephila clavata]|uniref:RNase H type-1 domain-containing protein n=1 Tax=Trichonephila clavata TaxID=2740835 RepID=A0A8X6G5U7_TRICU|nr:uncharacterized protein TNCT_376901 [Trichonephila clavata]